MISGFAAGHASNVVGGGVRFWPRRRTSRNTFPYDAVGNRTAMIDSLGADTASYDALNRPSSVVDPAGKRITDAYDPRGHRAWMDALDSGRFTYQYDGAGRIG